MKFRLQNFQRPGDILMLTALVRDLKIAYPEVEIAVATSKDELFENNPHLKNTLTPVVFDTASKEKESIDEFIDFRVGYDDGDKKDGRPEILNPFSLHGLGERHRSHFINGMIGYFNVQNDLHVELTDFRPEVFLTDEEKKPLIGLPENYWVVNMGFHDYSSKQWLPSTWERLIKMLPEVTFVQMGGEGTHPDFKAPNLIDYTGKTTLRQALTLLYNSSGAVLPVTFAHHAMSMWPDKPCIVLGGGREQWYWEAYDYPKHHFLHTMNALPCCPKDKGCWSNECFNKVLKGDSKDEPKCLNMITPEYVAGIVRQYVTKGDSHA